MEKERAQSRFYERSLDVCKVAVVVSWVLVFPSLLAVFVINRPAGWWGGVVMSFYLAQSLFVPVGIVLGLLGSLRYPVIGGLGIFCYIMCIFLTPSVTFRWY